MQVSGGESYLAANHGANAIGNVVDDTVFQRQVVRGHADGANEEMAVTATGFQQVHVLVVNLEAGGILNLGAERVGDVVPEGLGGNCALRRGQGSPGEQGREGSPVDHVGKLLTSFQECRSTKIKTGTNRLGLRGS
jgi:hypothetical protein